MVPAKEAKLPIRGAAVYTHSPVTYRVIWPSVYTHNTVTYRVIWPSVY